MATSSAAAATSPAVAVKKASIDERSDNASAISNSVSNSAPTTNPSMRPSRWSDAPPTNDGHSASELPPQKKVKNEASSLSNSGDSVTGVKEGPPGLPYTQNPSSTVAVPNYGAVSDDPSTGYGAQQQSTGYQSYGSQYQTNPPVHGSFAPGSAKGTGALFYKTKLCTKFKIGACTFNERCHFAHGVEDLRKPPPFWETMAATGSTAGALGGTFPRPKTRPCKYFAEGNCPYNERCNFLHGNEDPQRVQGSSVAYGSYAPSGIQQPIVAPAQPQGYSGGSAYPNGSSVSTSMQYPNTNPGYSIPSPYVMPSSVPSSVSASYGTQPEYSPAGSMVPSMTSYGSTPVTANTGNPYPSVQDGTNGASASYNSWGGPGYSANPASAYGQTNQHVTNQGYQTASWMPNYAGASTYPKVDSLATAPQCQEQTQQSQIVHPQQNQVLQPQQSQVVQPQPSQVVQQQQNQVVSSAPYAQGVSQLGGASTYTDANQYQSTYAGAGYSNPQVDYVARYNMAEPWGGQTQ